VIFLPEAIGLAASLTSSKKEGITQNLARMANIIKDSSSDSPEEGDHMQLVEDTDNRDKIDFEPYKKGRKEECASCPQSCFKKRNCLFRYLQNRKDPYIQEVCQDYHKTNEEGAW